MLLNEMNKKSYSLGGEQSGHIILGEYTKTGDGILVALKILEILKDSNVRNASDSYLIIYEFILLKKK